VGGKPVRTDHTRSEVLDCAIERIDDDRLRVGDAVIDLSS
jgi:hypothetical protein